MPTRLLKFRSLFKAAIVFLAFTSAISVQAQVTTGTVRGEVTDKAGAVVPGATVTITDPKTTTSQTAETGNAGCVGLGTGGSVGGQRPRDNDFIVSRCGSTSSQRSSHG